MAEWLSKILSGPVKADDLAGCFPWAKAMIGCPHDSFYHAEGDPWTHTGMVAAALEAEPSFASLSRQRQDILRLAAWFHDVAKPMTTKIEWDEVQGRERVRQPGHAPLGAVIAWQALIDAGVDAKVARDVHALVFWHQRPGHMLDQNNPERRLVQFSMDVTQTNWDDLLRLCRADQKGRISPNTEEVLQDLDLVGVLVDEAGADRGMALRNGPWVFENDETRLGYLRVGADGGPGWFTRPEPNGSTMTIMSGLPGSGKNTAINQYFKGTPVVEMDTIRQELGISPTDNQGHVIQAAFEAARVHLRAGEDFIWNATCLSRLTRQKIVSLARNYDARIVGVSMDVPFSVAKARNSKRENPVPDKIMEKLAMKREPIITDEAHACWSCNADGYLKPVFGGNILHKAEHDLQVEL